MKEMQLSQGMIALVDDEDYKYLKLFKWYAKKSKSSWYVVRMERLCCYSYRGRKVKKRRIRKVFRMHNIIMKPKDNQIVHHEDGDGLNNQRENLKLTTLVGNNEEARNKRNQNPDYMCHFKQRRD